MATAVALGCHPRTEVRWSDDCGVPSAAALAEQPPEIRLAPARTGELRVSVQSWSGMPLSAATIAVLRTAEAWIPPSGDATEDGALVFRGIPRGQYVVSVGAVGYRRRSIDVVLPPDSSVHVRVRLAEDRRQLNCDGIVQSRRPWWKLW